MNSFKITFANGDYLVTSLNGTYKDAVEYYLGNYFNIGRVEDNMQKCTKVEAL
jgi:lipocalin